MNAPAAAGSEAITIRIGDATVTVPAHAAALAYLEQRIDEQRLAQIDVNLADALRRNPPLMLSIGADHGGGKYAGITVHEEQPYKLVLLPGENESCTWADAKAWAEAQGGYLPSRFDQLVLFKNLKAEFKEAWYWSGEQRAGDESYAWGQNFGNGSQYWGHVSSHGRARAVRRLVIQ